jgi:uncharacterized membrane protein
MPLLILAYPLLAHLATAMQDLRLQWAALTMLAAIPFYERLRGVQPGAWAVWLCIAAALYGLVFLGGGQYALFIPPVLLPAAAGMLFGESLLPGRTPLITRIARAARGGSLPAELAGYTRRVTVLWTILLFSISLVSAALALFAPLHIWSLFTNMICYLILGAMFPAEYVWRRWRHRGVDHPGFWTYLRQVARINYRKV